MIYNSEIWSGLTSAESVCHRDVVRLNADHYRAFKLLGSALYALGDLAGAERALRDSLAIQPSYSDALCDLGETPIPLKSYIAFNGSFLLSI